MVKLLMFQWINMVNHYKINLTLHKTMLPNRIRTLKVFQWINMVNHYKINLTLRKTKLPNRIIPLKD